MPVMKDYQKYLLLLNRDIFRLKRSYDPVDSVDTPSVLVNLSERILEQLSIQANNCDLSNFTIVITSC